MGSTPHLSLSSHFQGVVDIVATGIHPKQPASLPTTSENAIGKGFDSLRPRQTLTSLGADPDRSGIFGQG
jgi:hypothetical protein